MRRSIVLVYCLMIVVSLTQTSTGPLGDVDQDNSSPYTFISETLCVALSPDVTGYSSVQSELFNFSSVLWPVFRRQHFH